LFVKAELFPGIILYFHFSRVHPSTTQFNLFGVSLTSSGSSA
jgi:hypothetical protein